MNSPEATRAFLDYQDALDRYFARLADPDAQHVGHNVTAPRPPATPMARPPEAPEEEDEHVPRRPMDIRASRIQRLPADPAAQARRTGGTVNPYQTSLSATGRETLHPIHALQNVNVDIGDTDEELQPLEAREQSTPTNYEAPH